MIAPITTNTFQMLCRQWAEVINRGESGLQMWPPVGDAPLRVKQLIADHAMQKEIFGNDIPLFVLGDANDLHDLSFEEFEKLIEENMLYATGASLSDFLQANDRRLVIFLVGFDTALKEGRTDTLNRIARMIHTHNNVSAILCTYLNLMDTSLDIPALQNIFLQNIFYSSLYTFDDTIQFFKHLEEKWNSSFDSQKIEELAKAIGGHFWLVKEAARILRANPSYSIPEILNYPTLINKGLMLFRTLHQGDQETILQILRDNRPSNVSNYLLQTHMVKNYTVLPYLSHLSNHLLGTDISQHSFEKTLAVYFTPAERETFAKLIEKKTIVPREEIAQILWHDKSEDLYSDWAIDQLMYRIRKKIMITNAPYHLITKKGEGFLLTDK